MSENKLPEVVLGALRFAKHQAIPSSQNKKVASDKSPDTSFASNVPPIGFRRPAAEERMAADKPGQELAHDATIWELYLEEADEHDQELVRGRHTSLDLLLLFAALFSAILTAFLIESKDLLQQDSADSSVALLLMIAQSQQRMELGISPPDNSSIVDIPPFSPTMLLRWINGLWFISLGLALSAALIAMLAKEWLTAFLASRPRPPHSHALLRQARLEGLDRWWALHIIALLPTLLHASLLLFAVGLVMYLWTLDIAIAVVLSAIVGGTLLFYGITAVLGAVYEFCPFVTEVSGYVRRATVAVLGGQQRNQHKKLSRYPTVKDLQALSWLANNARDPAVVDSQIAEDNTISTLLSAIVQRFERLTTDPYELAGASDGCLTRYLQGILALSSYIRSNLGDSALVNAQGAPLPSTINRHTRRLSELQTPLATDIVQHTSPFQLLSMTRKIFENDGLLLNADAYTGLLVTEMDIIMLAALDLNDHCSTEVRNLASVAQNTAYIGAHVLEIIPSQGRVDTVQNLRAHYSSWLAHVTVVLRLHADGVITIGTRALDDIFKAMTLATQHDILNPVKSISTHHPREGTSGSCAYQFVVPFNENTLFHIKSDDLCAGPLGTLLSVLRLRTSPHGPESLVQTCLGALKAYSAWAPVLLQQVLDLPERDELRKPFDLNARGGTPSSDMIGIRYTTVRLALLTIRFLARAYPNAATAHPSFCKQVLGLMDFCLLEEIDAPSRKDSFRALSEEGGSLVEFAGESKANYALLTPAIKLNLINASRQRTTSNDVTAIESSFTPACFPPFIRMVAESAIEKDIMSHLLQIMVRRLRASHSATSAEDGLGNGIPSIKYLRRFTHSGDGFSALAYAGAEKNYIQEVAEATIGIVNLAASRDESLVVKISPSALLGLLDTTALVVEYCRGIGNPEPMLFQFSDDFLNLLSTVPENSKSFLLLCSHSALEDLISAWEATTNSEAILALTKKLDSVRSWDGWKILVAQLRERIRKKHMEAANVQHTQQPPIEEVNENTPRSFHSIWRLLT